MDSSGCCKDQTAAGIAPAKPERGKSEGRRGLLTCCRKPSVADDDATSTSSADCIVTGEAYPGAAGGTLSSKGGQQPAIQLDSEVPALPEGDTGVMSSGVDTLPPRPSSSPEEEEEAPLTATSINRTYTMEDWDAMMAHIREHGSEVFYDARSYASSTNSADSGVDQLGDGPAAAASTSRGAAARQAAAAAIPRSLVPKGAAAPWTPQPALEWADPSWEYRPVDARAFYGLWLRCMMRSTPPPFPTNLALQSNPLTRAIQESVTRMELRESADRHCLEVVPKPEFMPVPASMGYTERFPLDGSEGRWTVRRDITSLGHSTGQVYMTTDDILVVRVRSYGVFSRNPVCIAEDYMRLEDGGQTLVAKLGAMDMNTKRQGHNLMVLSRI